MRLKHLFILVTTISQIIYGMEQPRALYTASKTTAAKGPVVLPSYQQLLKQIQTNKSSFELQDQEFVLPPISSIPQQKTPLSSLHQIEFLPDSTQTIAPNPEPAPPTALSNIQPQPLTLEQILTLHAFPTIGLNDRILQQTVIISPDNNTAIIPCKHCKSTFFTKKDLRTHTRKKHQEKPFECDKCSRRFISKQGYDQHRIHLKKCPYGCPQPFCTETLVKQHIRKVHPKALLHCTHCNKDFTTDRHLRNHVQKNIPNRD